MNYLINYLNESTDRKIKFLEEGFVKNNMVSSIPPPPKKSFLKDTAKGYMDRIKRGEFLPIAGGLALFGAASGLGYDFYNAHHYENIINDINSKLPENNRVDLNNIDYKSVHEKMDDYNKLYNKFAKYDANHDSFLDKDEIRKAKNSIQYQAENFKDNHFIKNAAGFNPYDKDLEDLKTYYDRYIDSNALDINKDRLSTAEDVKILKALDKYGDYNNSYLNSTLVGTALGGIGGTGIYYTMKATNKSGGGSGFRKRFCCG